MAWRATGEWVDIGDVPGQFNTLGSDPRWTQKRGEVLHPACLFICLVVFIWWKKGVIAPLQVQIFAQSPRPNRDFTRDFWNCSERRGNNGCGIPRHESSCLQIESLAASCQPQRRSEIQLSLWFASTGHWAAIKHVTLCHQHGFTADYFSRFEDGLWLLHLQDRIFHFKSLHKLISYQGTCTLGCNPMMDKAAFSGIITEPSAVTRPLTMWSATDFSSSASQGWIGMGFFQNTYLSKTLLFINSYHSEHSEVNRCPWCVLIFWKNARTFFFRRIFVRSFKCQLQSVSNAPIEACLAFFASSACFATSASLANSASLASSACTKNSVVSFHKKMVPMSQSNCRLQHLCWRSLRWQDSEGNQHNV